jgi:hypothetical protein
MLELLAFLCFLVAAIWSAVTKSWTLALVAAGLALWVLAGSDLTNLDIHTGK